MTPNDQFDHPSNANSNTNINDIQATPGTERPGYQRWIARLIIATLLLVAAPDVIGQLFPAIYEQAILVRNSATIIIAIFFVITLLKMLTERRPNAKN